MTQRKKTIMGEQRNELEHRMSRRSVHNDYSTRGIYHITLRVADTLHQPLGRVVGSLAAADGSPDAPRVELTAMKDSWWK